VVLRGARADHEALGDPLVDLGILLAYWAANASAAGPRDSLATVTTLPGWLTSSELVERYAAVTGWEVSHVGYYRAFCLWRIAIIAEGIKRRYASGALGDKHADPDALERRVRDRAALAEQALSGTGASAF